MKTGRFYHQVEIEVEFTGLDLLVLEYHARQHYDRTCKKFFEPDRNMRGENDGCIWKAHWQFKDWKERFGDDPDKKVEPGEMRDFSENLELTVVEKVSSRTLDLCMKILERLGYEESWEMVAEIFGKEMPPIEKQMGELARELSEKIRGAFFAIQEEWRRLDSEETAAKEQLD